MKETYIAAGFDGYLTKPINPDALESTILGYLPKEKKREYAGRDFMNDYLPVQGHTVVKVAPGGASWEFFVLTADDESMTVLHHQEMDV